MAIRNGIIGMYHIINMSILGIQILDMEGYQDTDSLFHLVSISPRYTIQIPYQIGDETSWSKVPGWSVPTVFCICLRTMGSAPYEITTTVVLCYIYIYNHDQSYIYIHNHIYIVYI